MAISLTTIIIFISCILETELASDHMYRLVVDSNRDDDQLSDSNISGTAITGPVVQKR